MEYKILYGQSMLSIKKAIEALNHAVMEAIALGWEPIGGVTISEHNLAAQAMIKRR